MTAIDLIVLVLLVIGGYRGYRKGLLLEIIAIAAFILGIVGGLKLMHWGINLFETHLQWSGTFIPVVSFILIFIMITILITLLGRLLKNLINLTLLGSLDNLAGAAIGLIKWAFGLSALIWFFNLFGVSVPPDMTENAFVYPQIAAIAPKVIGYLSSIFPFIDDLLKSATDYLN